MIKILGDAPPVKRILTGLYSFDRAFINRKGDIGYPIGKGLELFGVTHIGKSTVVYGLAGIVAEQLGGHIALADLEGFDPDFLTDVLEMVGYTGDVNYINEGDDKEILGDEKTLNALISTLRDEKYSVGILDSIGAISPVSEQKGDLGDANWGRRGMLMAQFSRKGLKILREHSDSKAIFAINHYYPRMSGFGYQTPGGEVKNYIFSMLVHVARVKIQNSNTNAFSDGSYIIKGTVKKNRWGLKDKEFYLFMLSGRGIHPGLTAVWDCYKLGLATRSGSIKMGDKTYGTLKNIMTKEWDNPEFFQPFYDYLRKGEKENALDT